MKNHIFLNDNKKEDKNHIKIIGKKGNNAISKKKLITNENHLVITSSHPSPLSARHSFNGSKVFSRINLFLKENNLNIIDFEINQT